LEPEVVVVTGAEPEDQEFAAREAAEVGARAEGRARGAEQELAVEADGSAEPGQVPTQPREAGLDWDPAQDLELTQE
jgi:hypothetical protein